jgi:hypothetical protein
LVKRFDLSSLSLSLSPTLSTFFDDEVVVMHDGGWRDKLKKIQKTLGMEQSS